MVPENQYNLAGESSRPETAIHRAGLRCQSAAPSGGILLSRPNRLQIQDAGPSPLHNLLRGPAGIVNCSQ